MSTARRPTRRPKVSPRWRPLWATIAQRAADPPGGLLHRATRSRVGSTRSRRKVTEEATEVLLAARDDAEAARTGAERTATREALAGEVADLLYHTLVLLAERGLPPAAVLDTLRARRRP